MHVGTAAHIFCLNHSARIAKREDELAFEEERRHEEEKRKKKKEKSRY